MRKSLQLSCGAACGCYIMLMSFGSRYILVPASSVCLELARYSPGVVDSLGERRMIPRKVAVGIFSASCNLSLRAAVDAVAIVCESRLFFLLSRSLFHAISIRYGSQGSSRISDSVYAAVPVPLVIRLSSAHFWRSGCWSQSRKSSNCRSK